MVTPYEVDLQVLPVAALATRGDTVVAANAAFEALTGWSAADMVGKTVIDATEVLWSSPARLRDRSSAP